MSDFTRRDDPSFSLRRALLITAITWLFIVAGLEGLVFLLSAYLCQWGLGAAVRSKSETLHQRVSTVLMLADTHVLGYRHRIWIDVLWSDWGLFKALAAAFLVHTPDLVVVNGDVFDEANKCSDEEFEKAMGRFKRLMGVVGAGKADGQVPLMLTVGNHDIGHGWQVSSRNIERIQKDLGPVQWARCWRNVSFLGINTQVFPPDSDARMRAAALEILRGDATRQTLAECGGGAPIVLQHMPLFRESDLVCGDGVDACVGQEGEERRGGQRQTPEYCRVTSRGVTYKERGEHLQVWHDDVMDQITSDMVLEALQPAIVLSAHTHAPCFRTHTLKLANRSVPEVTLPTLAWRMRPDAGYVVAALAHDPVRPYMDIHWCGLPDEHGIMCAYISALVMTVLAWVVLLVCVRRKGAGGQGTVSSAKRTRGQNSPGKLNKE